MAQVVNAYIDIADWTLGSFNSTRTVGLGDAYRVQYRGWTTVRVDYIPGTLSLRVSRNWHQWDSTVQYSTEQAVQCCIEVPIITLKKSLILSLGKRSGSTQPLRDEKMFSATCRARKICFTPLRSRRFLQLVPNQRTPTQSGASLFFCNTAGSFYVPSHLRVSNRTMLDVVPLFMFRFCFLSGVPAWRLM